MAFLPSLEFLSLCLFSSAVWGPVVPITADAQLVVAVSYFQPGILIVEHPRRPPGLRAAGQQQPRFGERPLLLFHAAKLGLLFSSPCGFVGRVL